MLFLFFEDRKNNTTTAAATIEDYAAFTLQREDEAAPNSENERRQVVEIVMLVIDSLNLSLRHGHVIVDSLLCCYAGADRSGPFWAQVNQAHSIFIIYFLSVYFIYSLSYPYSHSVHAYVER